MNPKTLPLVALVLLTLLGAADAGDRLYRPLSPSTATAGTISTSTIFTSTVSASTVPADDPDTMADLYEQLMRNREQAIEEQRRKLDTEIQSLAASLGVAPDIAAVRSRIAVLERYASMIRWIPSYAAWLADIQNQLARLYHLLALLQERATL